MFFKQGKYTYALSSINRTLDLIGDNSQKYKTYLEMRAKTYRALGRLDLANKDRDTIKTMDKEDFSDAPFRLDGNRK